MSTQPTTGQTGSATSGASTPPPPPSWDVSFGSPAIIEQKDAYEVGDKLRVSVRLAKHPDRSVTYELRAPALRPRTTAPVTIKANPKHRGREFEFEIPMPNPLPTSAAPVTHEIELVAITRCKVRGASRIQVKVNPPVQVEFAQSVVRPQGEVGVYPGEMARLTVKCNRPAPTGGIKVELRSDCFKHDTIHPGTVYEALIPEGQVEGTAVAMFYPDGEDAGDTAEVKVRLGVPANGPFVLKPGGLHEITVPIRKLPRVSFSSPADWIDPKRDDDTYYAGETVKLKMKLSGPAPRIGAGFYLRCPAFGSVDRPSLLIPENQTELQTDVQFLLGSAAEQEIGLTRPVPARGCLLAADEADRVRKIKVVPGPVIRFRRQDFWISPKKDEYLAGESVDLSVKLEEPARIDAVAKIVSAAFGGKAYFVHIAKGQTQPERAVKVKLTHGYYKLRRGQPTADPGEMRIELRPVRGCQPSDDVANMVKRVKVVPASPRAASNPGQSCALNRGKPPAPVPCNQHRLLIKELSGDGTPVERGHDSLGTWEVVASAQAHRNHLDAFTSKPTIQMICGDQRGELVDKKSSSYDKYHVKHVEISHDPADYYCADEFYHPKGDCQHPIVIVEREEQAAIDWALARGPGEGLVTGLVKRLKDRRFNIFKVENVAIGFSNLRSKATSGATLCKFRIENFPQKYGSTFAEAAISVIEASEGADIASQIRSGLSPVSGSTFRIRDIIDMVQTILLPRIRRYQIRTETCGLPDPSGTVAPVPASQLLADIEVYPSDEFCLFLNVTPFPSLKFGTSGTKINERGQTQPAAPDPRTEAARVEQREGILGSIPLSSASVNAYQQGGQQQPTSGVAVGQGMTQSTASTGGTLTSEADPGGTPEFGTRTDMVDDPHLGMVCVAQSNYRVITSDTRAATPVRTPDPKTRRFHEVTAVDYGVDPSETPDNGAWNVLRCGLARNGYVPDEHYPVGKAIEAIIYAVQHFNDLLETFQDMQASWGWGLNVDFGFLEGQFALRLGWKEYTDHRVFRWWQIDANLTLVRVGIELWVGVRARALFLVFQFVVYLRVEGAARADFYREKAGPDGGTLGETRFECIPSARFGARMILVHPDVLTGDAAVKTGYKWVFKFPDPEAGFKGILWEGYFLGVAFEVTIRSKAFRINKVKEWTLVEGSSPDLPHKEGILFPRGTDTGLARAAWTNLHYLKHVWRRVMAEFGRVQEALDKWYDLQLEFLKLRSKGEWETAAKTDPELEWPWADDSGVRLVPNSKLSTDESAEWKAQWGRFRAAVDDNFGWFAGRQYKRMTVTHELRSDLIDAIEKNEAAVIEAKKALRTIVTDYLDRLRLAQAECNRADEEEREVQEFVPNLLKLAKGWCDVGAPGTHWGRGDVRRIADQALERFDLKYLMRLLKQAEGWKAGRALRKPARP